MTILFSFIAVLFLGTVIFMRSPKFGKHPSGERFIKIQQSPNYKNGSFQNLVPTPMMSEDVNYGKMLIQFFTKKIKEPTQAIPTQKTDLLNLDRDKNRLVWMGHSSYFMQVDGKRILVDPVLCGYASPFSFSVKAYKGSDVYTVDDIPEIDYLFITHDHWDHMDYHTLKALKPKIKNVICGLGNGAHLERWGYNSSQILEGDWNESFGLEDGFKVIVTPSRHFSGRGFKRGQALWASFVMNTPHSKIFIGGDSGYGEHFSEIGKQHGPFDLAILENGQYDKDWKYIHMQPEEVLQATTDLNAKTLLPVHSGKFTLANHDWDEPLTRISANADTQTFRIITPMIGQQVNLSDSTQRFSKWWEGVE